MREPGSPSAAKERAGDSVTTLREHLSALSLGGGHPYVVVVPRDELGAVLDELDELREYQTQQEELIRRGR